MHGHSTNSLSQEFQITWYKNSLLNSIWKYQENTKENVNLILTLHHSTH